MNHTRARQSIRRTPCVLHVVHSVEPGGTERMLCRIVRALGQDDVRHVVCSLRHSRPFHGVLDHGIEAVSLGARGNARATFLRLAAVAWRLKADIIHSRNWGTWTDAVLAADILPRTRLVLGFHGLQHGSRFSAVQRRRARWLGMQQRAFTAVSQEAKHILHAGLGVSKDRIRVISNGVDVDRFRPSTAGQRAAARQCLGLCEQDVVIGCVANLFKEVKGHAVLVDAFARVVGQRPRAKLMLVGYGPLDAAIRRQAGERGILDRIIFTGQREDVASLLSAMDVYACPSFSEGMSNALLEAMATGLPCVVTDVSDHRVMFDRIDPRTIVPAGDCHALSSRLIELADSREKRARVGALSRKVVEQSYRFDQTVAGYRRLYEEQLFLGRSSGHSVPITVSIKRYRTAHEFSGYEDMEDGQPHNRRQARTNCKRR